MNVSSLKCVSLLASMTHSLFGFLLYFGPDRLGSFFSLVLTARVC